MLSDIQSVSKKIQVNEKYMGSPPVDQQGQAQPAAGFRLFIDGGEVGLDRSFGDLEPGDLGSSGDCALYH
jgi:hypothetical protein